MDIWRIWSKSLGEKAHKKDDIADQVALIRTIIFLTYFTTNCFIIAGVVRHWNDAEVQNVTGKMQVLQYRDHKHQ